MLYKNILRSFSRKWIQLLALGGIVLLCSAIYSMMFYSLSSFEDPTRQFLEEYRLEDFSIEMKPVLTQKELTDPDLAVLAAQGKYTLSDIKEEDPNLFFSLAQDRISEFSSHYSGFELELRQYRIISYSLNGTEHKAMVLKDAERINLSMIEEGTSPSSDSEICVSRVYARKNNLEIGDSLSIGGRSYVLSGFVLFPDYNFPMIDNSFNVNTGIQTTALMSDNAFEALGGDEGFHLSGASLSGTPVDDSFYKYDIDYVSTLTDKETTLWSGAIFSEMTQGWVMGIGLSLFIGAIGAAVVALMLYHLLHGQRSQIGLMKAIGYSKGRIAKPYLLSISLFTFLLLLAGYFVGYLLSEPMKGLYVDFYLVPYVPIVHKFGIFATSVFVPLLFFSNISAFIISRILSERPLSLLHPPVPKVQGSVMQSVSKLLKRMKASTKFKYLYAMRNTLSFIVFFVGILFFTILIQFSFMTKGIVQRMTVGYLDKVDYEYIAFVDPIRPLPLPAEGEEKFLKYPYADMDGLTVSMEGISPYSTLYRLYDDKDRVITSELVNGVVISRRLSMKEGIDTGDSISVRIEDDLYSFRVNGVADEFLGDSIYLDITSLSMILSSGADSDLFSGVYAKSEPSASSYESVTSKASIIEQSSAMSEFVNVVTSAMVGGSALISTFLLFVLSSLTVEGSYYQISLLKVLGYSKREVNRMILNSYLAFSVVSYFLSIPLALLVIKGLMRIFASGYRILIPFEFQLLQIIWGLLFVIGIFYVGSAISRRRISKVPLQEVLKAYGE